MPSRRWDLLLTPIIIEIISWLDQESLMNLSLVSKQLYNIIRNEPGNKNKIIPVFEVSGSLEQTFFHNLHDHFLNIVPQPNDLSIRSIFSYRQQFSMKNHTNKLQISQRTIKFNLFVL